MNNSKNVSTSENIESPQLYRSLNEELCRTNWTCGDLSLRQITPKWKC